MLPKAPAGQPYQTRPTVSTTQDRPMLSHANESDPFELLSRTFATPGQTNMAEEPEQQELFPQNDITRITELLFSLFELKPKSELVDCPWPDSRQSKLEA